MSDKKGERWKSNSTQFKADNIQGIFHLTVIKKENPITNGLKFCNQKLSATLKVCEIS